MSIQNINTDVTMIYNLSETFICMLNI